MSMSHRGSIVAHGTWLHANKVPCRIAIVRRDVMYGTGDAEDAPEVADDKMVETFEVLYEPAGGTDFSAAGGQYRTLDEACAAAERACGPTVRWEDSVPMARETEG